MGIRTIMPCFLGSAFQTRLTKNFSSEVDKVVGVPGTVWEVTLEEPQLS